MSHLVESRYRIAAVTRAVDYTRDAPPRNRARESDTDCSVETTRVLDPAAPEGLRELSRTSERSGCPP
jgi:hypothetical protein